MGREGSVEKVQLKRRLMCMYCTCRAQCLCLTAISFACKISLFHCAPSCPSAAIDVSSTKDMLAAMYRLYQSSHLMSTIKKILFKFFTSLVFDEDHLLLRNDNVSTVLEKWLQSLPRMLVQLKTSCPEMTSLVLKVMANALMRKLIEGERSLCQHLVNTWLYFLVRLILGIMFK